MAIDEQSNISNVSPYLKNIEDQRFSKHNVTNNDHNNMLDLHVMRDIDCKRAQGETSVSALNEEVDEMFLKN